MNLFKKVPGMSTEKQIDRRITIADLPLEIFKLFEQVYAHNRRLAAMAEMLGGVYPIPAYPPVDPAENVCDRIGFDLANTNTALEETCYHISQLERLLGVATEIPQAMPPQKTSQKLPDEPHI